MPLLNLFSPSFLSSTNANGTPNLCNFWRRQPHTDARPSTSHSDSHHAGNLTKERDLNTGTSDTTGSFPVASLSNTRLQGQGLAAYDATTPKEPVPSLIEPSLLQAPFAGDVDDALLEVNGATPELASGFVFDAASFSRLLAHSSMDSFSSLGLEREQALWMDLNDNGTSELPTATTPTLQLTSSQSIVAGAAVSRTRPIRSTRRSISQPRPLPQHTSGDDFEQSHWDSCAGSTAAKHFTDLNIGSTTSTSTLANLGQSSASPISSTSIYFPPSASALHQKRRKAKKHALRVPRPKNCFMLYRSRVLPMIMVELGQINNKIISKIAAERWRAETEPVKAWYRMMAKQGKEEHARNNPGYKYAPHKKTLAPLTGMRAVGNEVVGDEMLAEMDEDYSCAHQDLMEEDDGDNPDDGDYPSPRRRSTRTLQQSRAKANQTSKRTRTTTPVPDPLSPSPKTHSNENGGPCKRIQMSQLTVGKQSHVMIDLGVGPSPLRPFSGVSSFPAQGPSLIEQQLYLAMPKSTNTNLPRLYHQQLQHHCISPVQLTATGSTSGATSDQPFYNLGDNSSSSATLVDPINHWLNQRYHDPNLLFEHLDLSNSHSAIHNGNSNNNNFTASLQHLPTDLQQHIIQQQIHFQRSFYSMKEPGYMPSVNMDHFAGQEPNFYPSMAVLTDNHHTVDPTKQHPQLQSQKQSPAPKSGPFAYFTEKELPPLPAESLTSESSTGQASDATSVLSRLFEDYSSDQDRHPQLPSPSTPSSYLYQSQQGPLVMHSQPPEHSSSFQDYLIKPPSASLGFMSFSDIGQGTQSMTDFFTWPGMNPEK